MVATFEKYRKICVISEKLKKCIIFANRKNINHIIMKRVQLYLFFMAVGFIALSSCEGCVKNTSKKFANAGLDILEGVAEALEERGDSIGKKVFDASGKVLEGAGLSIDEQLDKHAEDVASVMGRTLVQSLEGLDQGFSKEYYEEFIAKEFFCDDVVMNFFGRVKDRKIADAYFSFLKEGKYSITFEFCSDNCNTVILTKTAEFNKVAGTKEFAIVSFAYTSEEEILINETKCVKVTVKK